TARLRGHHDDQRVGGAAGDRAADLRSRAHRRGDARAVGPRSRAPPASVAFRAASHPDVGLHAGRSGQRRCARRYAAPAQAVHDAGPRAGAHAGVRERAGRRRRGGRGALVSQPRVLIVDDDEHVCFVAARALERIAICDTAHDVGQATRALRRQAYDLVLVDVGLPGPSGMTLLEDLRHEWPQTGAVVLSGFTDLSTATEALERGALGYVVKPFRVRDLRIQVTAALSGVHRSANAGRATARARVVTDLDAYRADGDRIACIVVDLECVPLLNASYGVDATERLCECVEERLRALAPDVEMLGKLGPASFAAAFRPNTGRTSTETARAVYRTL